MVPISEHKQLGFRYCVLPFLDFKFLIYPLYDIIGTHNLFSFEARWMNDTNTWIFDIFQNHRGGTNLEQSVFWTTSLSWYLCHMASVLDSDFWQRVSISKRRVYLLWEHVYENIICYPPHCRSNKGIYLNFKCASLTHPFPECQANWRYWPNIGCYEFSFQRTVFFDITDDAEELTCDGCRGSELRRLYNKHVMSLLYYLSL